MTIDRRTFLARTAGAGTAGWLAGGLPIPAHAQAAGTLNVALFPEPNALIAGAGSTGPAQMVNGNIYEGLMRVDEHLQPQPNLATSWTIGKDGLSYVFKLKAGVKWHDGAPFTADDVVFTVDRLLRALNPRVRVAMQSVKSVRALDPLTVEFLLNYPYAAFLAVMDGASMPIAPKHLLGNADLSKPLAGTPIGTGPFRFKEWVRGSHIALVRNDAYHVPGLPRVDAVLWHVIPDGASRAAAFESGKVDVLPGGTVEYFDVARLAKLPGVAVTQKGFEKYGPIAFVWINHRNPVLADVRVRRAIMHAIDRDAMAKVIWQGFATPATGPMVRTNAFYTKDVPTHPRDLAKARKLLAEAGYAGQPIRLLGLPFGETWQRMSEMAKQHLTQAGLKVETQNADMAGTMARQANWDFDLAFTFLYTMGDPAIGIARNYMGSEIAKGSPFNNVGGYQNPRVDALFERGSREIDPRKRAELYAQVQRVLVEDVAAAWLLELDFPTVYRTRVDNPVNSGMGLNDGLARASIRA
jgi:peptide/nickel transport system substrate-binding protein